jgi:acetylornithine deacetylase/succinyl-diaminopimelate desuccinylase-like protein
MTASATATFPAIASIAATPAFRQELVDLLVTICNIDTSPRPDVAALGKAEHQVFDVLEKYFAACGIGQGRAERRAINPAIDQHPFFSQLYYTKTPQRPEGLSAKECYAGRANLMLYVDGELPAAGPGINYAINTHVDVIAPYFPPRIEGDTVFGRGACDDKGNAVALMGALKLVGAHLQKTGKRLRKNLTCMLVIEEEMGGNGSLSAAIDRDLKKRYDSLTVLEICESRLFPGNRGCVWFKVQGQVPGVNLFECAAFIIEQLEKEGRSIRSESDHPLFPHRPVQTCHGMLGHIGEHPSRINGLISFDIRFDGKVADVAAARKRITDVIQFALDEYTGVYGDKTKVMDKGTGKPKVDHHYDIEANAQGFTVTVHGSTGHMGSIFENDGAITKMMTMVRSLIRSRRSVAAAAGARGVDFHHTGWDKPSQLQMEGGQGFLPTHEMPDVQQRLILAVARGGDDYFRLIGRDDLRGLNVFKTTFDKLHNAAFAGPADSPEMKTAIECQQLAGIFDGKPVRGWDVSCDSRIFAKEYEDQGIKVITTGPGSLLYAHSDREQINITEMVKFAEFLAYYILRITGTH